MAFGKKKKVEQEVIEPVEDNKLEEVTEPVEQEEQLDEEFIEAVGDTDEFIEEEEAE